MIQRRRKESKHIRSSLKTSSFEGSWWAVMYGMVETYFGALFQNLTGFFYDILMSRKALIILLKFI